MMTIASKLGLLTFRLALLAAVLSVFAVLRDDALAAGVSALCFGHLDLLCTDCRSLPTSRKTVQQRVKLALYREPQRFSYEPHG